MSIEKEALANDRLAGDYFKIWESYPIQQLTHDIESAWLQEEIPPGSRVLLAGSGGGREIAILRELAAEIVAIDISNEMLRIGKDRFGTDSISWRLGNIENLDSDLKDFDFVVCIGGVLSYVRNPRSALKCLFESLHPSGKLICSIMHRAHPTESCKVDEKSTGRYRHPFEIAEIIGLLEDAGFTDPSIKGYRYLIDLIPRQWNSNSELREKFDHLLKRMSDIEKDFVDNMPAEKAKLLWISAAR